VFVDARVGLVHGKLSGTDKQQVMDDFRAGDIGVLVATTVIEVGVDVPNATVMIVEDADRFGLSQLYQLRGRVGRSTRMAYAYFTVRPDKMISEDAQKRLNAIREFTEFGSGFRIAMRDLEIRGAGSLVGAEQHGNLSSVGFDLFTQMLGQAVAEARGEVPEGDEPSEDPKALLAELDTVTSQMEDLITRINLTNSRTVSKNGETLAALLARRDIAIRKADILRNFLNDASRKTERRTTAEIRIISTVDVRALRKEVDRMSALARNTDNTIQALNWSTELL
jgi:superfamily II DNA or RNA helicase